jgi:hypothetical protein
MPPPATIAGRVVDKNGQPVAGARVYLERAPVAVPDIAQLTGRDGRFSMTAPAPGLYRVAVTIHGRTQQRDVRVGHIPARDIVIEVQSHPLRTEE